MPPAITIPLFDYTTEALIGFCLRKWFGALYTQR